MKKGSKFDDFLKDENIEIDEEKIKENIEQMTVKEIIIDGVNVAECHTNQEYYNLGMWHGMAIGSKEELDRLKAENERLKEKIESYVCSQNCYAYKQADKYRKTLQEIKAITKGVRSYLKVPTPRDVRYEMDRILDLITKAESEG